MRQSQQIGQIYMKTTKKNPIYIRGKVDIHVDREICTYHSVHHMGLYISNNVLYDRVHTWGSVIIYISNNVLYDRVHRVGGMTA